MREQKKAYRRFNQSHIDLYRIRRGHSGEVPEKQKALRERLSYPSMKARNGRVMLRFFLLNSWAFSPRLNRFSSHFSFIHKTKAKCREHEVITKLKNIVHYDDWTDARVLGGPATSNAAFQFRYDVMTMLFESSRLSFIVHIVCSIHFLSPQSRYIIFVCRLWMENDRLSEDVWAVTDVLIPLSITAIL